MNTVIKSLISTLFGSIALLALALTTGCGSKDTEAPFAPTGEFDVNVVLSTNLITVGETINARIDVFHPADGLATIPELDRRPEIVVRDRRSSTEAYDEQLAITTVNYVLTSYRVGIHSLSTGMVSCTISGSDPLEKSFPAMNLVVNSVLTNATEEVRDLRAVRTPESPFPWMIVAILGVVVLTIALAIVIALLVKKPAVAKPPPPPPPPELTALQALNQLKESGLIENLEFEPFYVDVSRILRRYIEERFALHAPEMTTEEFIQEASASHKLNTDHHMLVHHFLEECDMVKFAKLEPDQTAMGRVWESAVRFVNETTPGQNPYGTNPGGGA